mgnify:CR=1 FL=1
MLAAMVHLLLVLRHFTFTIMLGTVSLLTLVRGASRSVLASRSLSSLAILLAVVSSVLVRFLALMVFLAFVATVFLALVLLFLSILVVFLVFLVVLLNRFDFFFFFNKRDLSVFVLVNTFLDSMELFFGELMRKLWGTLKVVKHFSWHSFEHVFDDLWVSLVHLMDELNKLVDLLADEEGIPLRLSHVSPVIHG